MPSGRKRQFAPLQLLHYSYLAKVVLRLSVFTSKYTAFPSVRTDLSKLGTVTESQADFDTLNPRRMLFGVSQLRPDMFSLGAALYVSDAFPTCNLLAVQHVHSFCADNLSA